MEKSQTRSSKYAHWNVFDRVVNPGEQLPKVVRDEMNLAVDLIDRISEKSTEVSTICRGFVKPTTSLYKNQKHDAHFHQVCHLWAGRCLAYAQPRSIECVWGLQARANLYYHLGHFDECQRDAWVALDQLQRYKLVDPLATVNRLRELLGRAQAMANEHRPRPHWKMNNYERIDVASYQAVLKESNPAHPCLANSVEPAYNETWGRHLMATRDIRVGDMLLVEDMACCVMVKGKMHTNCAHCSAKAWCGVACDHCPHAFYCSVECRAAAWQAYHDVECPIFAKMNERRKKEERDDSLAALKLLIKFIKAEGVRNVIEIADKIDRDPESICNKFPWTISRTEFGSIYSLQDRASSDTDAEKIKKMLNKESLDYEQAKELPSDYDDILKMVLRRLQGNDANEDIDSNTMWSIRKIFQKLKMIFQANHHWFGLVPGKHSLSTYYKEIRGHALSYYSSLINHDCFHNCVLSVGKGGKLIVYAVAPIKQNEQITISYLHMVGFDLDVTKRRLQIAQMKQFICRCQGCAEDWSVLDRVVPRETLKPQIHKSAMMNELTSNNNWYLTREQIVSNKVVIEFIYKQLKEDSPATAFVESGIFMMHLVLAYHMLYGVELAMSEKCYSDRA